MSWKSIALCIAAASTLAACASPETKVLQPYTLANGATYQDVVSIGANGKGTAPTVTQIKTFELRHKSARLVTDAAGYEPSIANTVTGAAVSGLTSSVPLAIGLHNQRIQGRTKPGPAGPQGEIGPTGPAGPIGPTGPSGGDAGGA